MQEENLPWKVLEIVVKVLCLKYSGYPKHVREVVFYMNCLQQLCAAHYDLTSFYVGIHTAAV